MNYNNAVPTGKKETRIASLIQRLEMCLTSVAASDSRISTIVDRTDGARPSNEMKADDRPMPTSTLSKLQDIVGRLENVSSSIQGNVTYLEELI